MPRKIKGDKLILGGAWQAHVWFRHFQTDGCRIAPESRHHFTGLRIVCLPLLNGVVPHAEEK